jgi:RNA polymerase sigma factor (sigma-70 family)
MAGRVDHDQDKRGALARQLIGEGHDAFFKWYWPRLVRFLVIQSVTQTSHSSLAEDVAGETFVKAWDNWDTLLTAERPDSWLFRVASRELRRQEAKARDRGILMEDPAGNVADLGKAAVDDEWVADNLPLIAAIRTLPRREAEVIACRLQNYTTKETAEILGVSEGTARSQLSRATEKLRILLNNAGKPGMARKDPV